MKYTEFKEWCNERACDGCWGSRNIAISFINIIDTINSTSRSKFPLFRKKYKEKIWQGFNSEFHIDELIAKLNSEINDYKNKGV